MAQQDLDLLHTEAPELFQDRNLSPDWHEDLIIVPVEDVERVPGERVSDQDFTKVVVPPGFEEDEEESEGTLLESFGPELIEPGGRVPQLSLIIAEVLGGAHAGAPVPHIDLSKMPPPDCLAFYLPFHYYHPDWWGVYLLYDGVVWLAGEIARRSGGMVSQQTAFVAARLFLYYHEAFHHKTECFATRLELTHRKPLYKSKFEQYYLSTANTENWLEEGLANAAALIDTCRKLKDSQVEAALAGYVDDSPLGYNQGNVLRADFLDARCHFAEENQHTCFPLLPVKNSAIWKTAPAIFRGITNIKSRVNYVLPRSSPLAARLPFRPCLPPRKVKEKLRELVDLQFVRHGGRHEVWRTPTGRTVEIPRHPGDLGRGLLRSILKQAGLDMGLEEFLQA